MNFDRITGYKLPFLEGVGGFRTLEDTEATENIETPEKVATGGFAGQDGISWLLTGAWMRGLSLAAKAS